MTAVAREVGLDNLKAICSNEGKSGMEMEVVLMSSLYIDAMPPPCPSGQAFWMYVKPGCVVWLEFVRNGKPRLLHGEVQQSNPLPGDHGRPWDCYCETTIKYDKTGVELPQVVKTIQWKVVAAHTEPLDISSWNIALNYSLSAGLLYSLTLMVNVKCIFFSTADNRTFPGSFISEAGLISLAGWMQVVTAQR